MKNFEAIVGYKAINRLVVARNGRKDALIPVIRDCIVKLAPEEKMIVIHLIEGLVTE